MYNGREGERCLQGFQDVQGTSIEADTGIALVQWEHTADWFGYSTTSEYMLWLDQYLESKRPVGRLQLDGAEV